MPRFKYFSFLNFQRKKKEELDKVMTQHGEENNKSKSCGNPVLPFLLLSV